MERGLPARTRTKGPLSADAYKIIYSSIRFFFMNVSPGLTGLLAFLTVLDDRNIMYDLMHTSPSDITVYFTLVGKRVEVRFEENEVDWCCFTGDESMDTDFSELEVLIKAHI